MLPNSHDYALSELPQSRATKLVFYCGGEKCRASDSAAVRALQAGYTDVNVACRHSWLEGRRPINSAPAQLISSRACADWEAAECSRGTCQGPLAVAALDLCTVSSENPLPSEAADAGILGVESGTYTRTRPSR